MYTLTLVDSWYDTRQLPHLKDNAGDDFDLKAALAPLVTRAPVTSSKEKVRLVETCLPFQVCIYSIGHIGK